MDTSPTSAPAEAYGYSSLSTSAAQAALLAEMFTLKCETGILVVGLQDGEALWTPVRILCTLVTVSVASAWISRRKSIKKLLIFFSHWLSGLLYELTIMTQGTMISVCWVGERLEGFIKALKYLEQTSSNMLAITNLAICINLALVVNSHRTLSRVNSVSTPALVLLFLAFSVVAATASVPFWSITVVSGTAFWVTNADKAKADWIIVSIIILEFVVGICMFVIVSWLMVFRMRAIKECWKLHARIRYYFVLTVIGTAVNLVLGISGISYVFRANAGEYLLSLTWAFRYAHVALDTIVLYGVLGTRYMDEGGGSAASTSGTSSGRLPASSGLPRPSNHRGMKKQSGSSNTSSTASGGAVCSTQGPRQVRPTHSELL
ncbi:unnamed protein product [Ectocarpus sp. 4 AP-2014]